jgi:prepilin-type N-terminal cleavage/methylation domain-containing protein
MLFRGVTKNKNGGFTLVEMLVSVALFSVVLTVTLGSILTIADANRKARSLMSVMNNLNFAVDAITRSVKTGTNLSTPGNCVEVDQINYDASDPISAARVPVRYCLATSGDRGMITKQVGSGAALELTSPDVDIDYLDFSVFGNVPGEQQPRVAINMQGTVRVSTRVSSSFSIQTTVSQRQLNLGSGS